MVDTKSHLETGPIASDSAHRAGGRAARRQLRSRPVPSFPTLVRNVPVYEILPAEAIELIHEESVKILEEIGCEFRDDEAIAYWQKAGAKVVNTRVYIDRALLMELVGKVPSEYTLNARNPERTVKVGGKNSIFVPMYGAPYVRGFDGERRYGSKADLEMFHKLTHVSPELHATASVACEPMDIAVPHRHLHIIESCIAHSDKPFMGIVTSRERAEDTMAMAAIAFGADYVRDNPVMTSVVNCNSPLVWDQTMLDALKVYAAHNQPCLVTPFALCGASTSASTIGAVAQVNAEALAGLAFTQLVRAGSPQVYGQFMVAVDMKSGAPMGGTPEAAHMMLVMGQLARRYDLPYRVSGFHVGSKLPDAQAGYEANMLMHAAVLAGGNYIWHVAGWLEAGLCASVAKFVLDTEQLAGWYKYAQGVDVADLKDAMAAVREVGPAGHFLGTAHTLAKFETAFYTPPMMDFGSYEAWAAGGAKDAATRALERAKAMLDSYEAPALDPGIKEALTEYKVRRTSAIPSALS